ncbi:SixA phosphatase family protein [Glaciecola siphonariae]|uniref:SixA phosphatase family protein n=1 Tax=Glaciecola siphonariae TaxID=521012 RepID=A0ABV9LQQ5_9ALTE
MILIIMRHGEATPYQANDKSRALTRFGLTQSANAGKRLSDYFTGRGLAASIDQVWVSPYLRTQQTYDAVSEHMHFNQKHDTDLITPMGRANDVHDFIDGILHQQNGGTETADSKTPEHLMLISHMPLVSLLADKVCTGFNGKIFDTADILIIDYDPTTHIGQQIALYQSI